MEVTLTAAVKEWGLNRSTLRKALEASPQRVPGTLRDYTWYFDDESPQFLAWLRDHVLSRRVRGDLAPLLAMAKTAVTYHLWRVEGACSEEIARPLAVLLRLSTGASEQSGERIRIRVAFAEELGLLAGSAATVEYVEHFFRLVEGTGGGNPSSLRERGKLLLFAYTTYLQEILAQGDFVRLLEGGDYALGSHRLATGDTCSIEVDGHSIRGEVGYKAELGWYLLTRDRAVILIHAGMPRG